MLLCAFLMLMVVSDLGFCLDEADLDLKWENWKIMHQKEYCQPKQGFKKSDTCEFVWKLEANYQERQDNLKHFGENTSYSLYNMKCSLEGLPKCLDYRERGMVTPVKHQAFCRSCWAFSVVGALEGQLAKNTGQLLDLSPQNLVDCVRENKGCDGGLMTNAFAYVQKHGINSEKEYPYKAKQQHCHHKSSAIAARCKYFGKIVEGDECALAKALHDVGPLSVGFNANHETFWLYKSGVYYNEHCDKNKLDHGMVLVGYGDTAEGEKYWIVKNSFGITWGEDGYIRVARDRDNHCGIASDASYSII